MKIEEEIQKRKERIIQDKEDH